MVTKQCTENRCLYDYELPIDVNSLVTSSISVKRVG